MECQEPNPGLDYLLSISHCSSKKKKKKIKKNKQQITRHSPRSLFFVHFNVSAGGSCSTLNLCRSEIISFFFPETLYFLQNGVIAESAPSQPNSAHPEVNGPEGAGWPRAPEPSRHTTGRGCWHPPVKCLLPAVLLFSFSVFFFFCLSLIPLFQQEVIGIEKKKK